MSKKEIKVTIVEEDLILVEALKQMLCDVKSGEWDLNVDTYQDGQAFLLSKPELGEQPHIIIINDILSKRSGINVTQSLRQLTDSERFYIILMTLGQSEDEMVHALQSGVDYYLERPLNLRALQAVIERIIERQTYELSI